MLLILVFKCFEAVEKDIAIKGLDKWRKKFHLFLFGISIKKIESNGFKKDY